ncbi:hypothetical protein BpHYR1_032925 [Brachionus plicatilis]|uniref:Uncharacterized protein n=1 Tax=Brachionus plicatilis TaxID=10195 RepID=A0A3M7SWE4_BRAPC|nr:hypothetical protein BpHYR1_032925 [Brachionus plicatilis]
MESELEGLEAVFSPALDEVFMRDFGLDFMAVLILYEDNGLIADSVEKNFLNESFNTDGQFSDKSLPNFETFEKLKFYFDVENMEGLIFL